MCSLFSSARGSRPPNPHRPNLLEVTGTTMPLLSTVLAGFSVTIIVELLTQTEAGQCGTPLNIGLTLLAISVPFFLSSTIFSVWGQSYNYLILTKDVKEIMNFTHSAQEWKNYLDASHTIWQKWHTSTILFYYIGLIIFISGIDLLIYKYVGNIPAILIPVILLITTVIGFILESRSKKVREQP